MKNPHRQVGLRSGAVQATVNLPQDPRLRVGARLTLADHDDPTRWWTVEWISEHVSDKSALHTRGAWWTIR